MLETQEWQQVILFFDQHLEALPLLLLRIRAQNSAQSARVL